MKNIEKEIIETYERYNKNIKKDIIEALEEARKEGNERDSYRFTWILQRNLTRSAFEKWKNEEITTEEAIEKAVKRETKQNEKAKENKIKHLEAIKNYNDFTKINIIVEWTKSKTWGANPHATAEIWSEDKNGAPKYECFTGSASGWGYDKQSAAIAQALNQSNAVIKAFCEYKEKSLKKNKNIDKSGSSCTSFDNRDAICYGFGYSAIPYFEGGTGTSCFLQGFKLLKCNIQEIHGNASDCYIITRKLKK